MGMHIALLRGVNVGGNRKIPMADLRAALTKAGLANTRTLLHSGNVVFEGSRRSGAALERWLEAETVARVGVAAEYMVRTPAEWRAMIAANPFRAEASDTPALLHAFLCKEPPTAAQIKALKAAIPGREKMAAGSHHLYVYYPDGAGESRLNAALLDRLVGSATARNWNTVLKLAAMVLDS
ncbi:MAG TPA: DUF1697 domain-containing protein [Gemmatimonadales bacterium]|jgi:uncharacterized protein (DUF1697 family)|nr:DUF1697 domain-containing protein [Gemmatimonadales bacterium]